MKIVVRILIYLYKLFVSNFLWKIALQNSEINMLKMYKKNSEKILLLLKCSIGYASILLIKMTCFANFTKSDTT